VRWSKLPPRERRAELADATITYGVDDDSIIVQLSDTIVVEIVEQEEAQTQPRRAWRCYPGATPASENMPISRLLRAQYRPLPKSRACDEFSAGRRSNL
jgi:hypothetical protein